jgi:uncharacterized protein YjdB
MRKNLKKFSIVILILFAIIGIQPINKGTVANAATVGQQLFQPEDGWTRYDDTDSKIFYTSGIELCTNIDCYNKTVHGNNAKEKEQVKFQFYGTKLRIMTISHSASSGANIKIDGVDCGNFSNYSAKYVGCYLFFEKSGLVEGKHTVTIITLDKSKFSTQSEGNYFALDAIDIDSTGKLLTYTDEQPIVSSGITLNKTIDTLKAGQTDNFVATVTPNNTTNKGVKWTSSDTSVATVDSNGKVTAIKAGTTNIIATTTDGSNLSAKCAVTVTDTSTSNPTGDRAVLTITMSNNAIKTYDLSKDELNAFLNWMNSRGATQAYYIFENKPIGGNITNKDYIAYDKIEYFNVQEYKAQ